VPLLSWSCRASASASGDGSSSVVTSRGDDGNVGAKANQDAVMVFSFCLGWGGGGGGGKNYVAPEGFCFFFSPGGVVRRWFLGKKK